MEGPWSSATSVSAVLGLVSGVCLSAGALSFSRFVDASIDEERIKVQYVLGPSRSVLVSDIDEVVLLKHLDLPARTGTRPTPRVLLRYNDRTTLAFTPRDMGMVQALASRGVQPTVIGEPLTPHQASRRYRNAVGFGELISGTMVGAALVIPTIIVVWTLLRAMSS